MDDLISRQAAIDGILHLMPPNPNLDDGSAEQLNFSAWKCALTCAEASIKMLPSAQPEIVKCRECKHMQKDEIFHQCWCNGNMVKLDDYCSYAERRQDETNSRNKTC